MVPAVIPHPTLPAGYNADPNDGDEVDGAGTNWLFWPALLDAFAPLQPFVLTPEMLAAFDDCPDVVVACVENTVTVPYASISYEVPYKNDTVVVAAENDLIMVAWQDDTVMVPPSRDVTVPPQSDVLTPARQAEEVAV
jgi:hypothetical protein